MPNGDLLTLDYQFQLHNTLYGRGNNGVYLERGKTIEGLGVPDAKTQDVDLARNDGVFANPDYLKMREITIPAVVGSHGATETSAMTSLKALQLAWVPVIADVSLAFQFPGWGKFYMLGRPRGAKFDFELQRSGAIRVLLRFDCPTPTITYI